MRSNNFYIGIGIYIMLAFISCKKDETVIPTVRVSELTSINVQVNKMCFVSSTVGFAACNDSKLIKTTNGGSSWSEVSTFPEIINPDLSIADLSDVQFVSATKGFVLGGGFVYITNDSGSSWAKIMLGGNIEITCMDFPTENCGYLASDFAIYQTTNGGADWYMITKPSYGCEPFQIAFATADRGLVTDYFNYYTYYTVDGGNSWSGVYNAPITYARDIRFVSEDEGYAISHGIIFKTTNQGVTWSTVQSVNNATEFELSGVDVNSSLGLAVGDMSIFVSTNNGSNWEYRLTDKGINLDDWLTDVHVLNSTSAIASSTSGIFYKIELGAE